MSETTKLPDRDSPEIRDSRSRGFRKFPCPVCGDYGPYALWMDPDPPEACAYDTEWHAGSGPTIKSVTECAYQMKKAAQAAKWRKACPEEFDENGNMRPGGLARILTKLYQAGDREALVI